MFIYFIGFLIDYGDKEAHYEYGRGSKYNGQIGMEGSTKGILSENAAG